MAPEDLEKHYGFTFLAHNTFEERDKILKCGREKESLGLVKPEHHALGEQFRGPIARAYIPKVSIRFISEEVGHGLFAEESISKGDYVGEYTGVVRRNNRRYFESLNNYCYEYPLEDELGRSYVVDATQGNLTRFINHSYAPNLKPRYAFIEGFYHVIFLALRSIAVGEQLAYDYGKPYWELRGTPI